MVTSFKYLGTVVADDGFKVVIGGKYKNLNKIIKI